MLCNAYDDMTVLVFKTPGVLQEAMSEGLPHEGAWPHMVGADAAMDVVESFPSLFRCDTSQEHLRGALAIDLSAEDPRALGSLDPPTGICDIIGEDPPSRK